jgi:hypothetical protein
VAAGGGFSPDFSTSVVVVSVVLPCGVSTVVDDSVFDFSLQPTVIAPNKLIKIASAAKHLIVFYLR